MYIYSYMLLLAVITLNIINMKNSSYTAVVNNYWKVVKLLLSNYFFGSSY